MNMQYQNLETIVPRITKHFLKCPTASISAMFRHLRKSSSASFFGDYPIISTVLNTTNSLHITLSRQQVLYALNQSEELKHCPRKLKMRLLEQLLNPSTAAVRSTKNRPQQNKSEMTSNQSLGGKEG